jgi:bla regulator protein BlaR1
MIPESWPASWTASVVNHLWQSTAVVAMAWLLALALRKNNARVRYWVWMTASVKFLVPFSVLIAAGERIGSLFAAQLAVKPSLVGMVQQIEQPFPPTEFIEAMSPAAVAHRADWLPLVLAIAWICGTLLVASRWIRSWLLVRAVLRNASPLAMQENVAAFSTDARIEPGVFGVVRPVLLLPKGVLNRLSGEQLDAIVAHEMCHVRRRDNLTFAIHMVVEALFWFHPAVWWIQARLIEERECACDEAVMQAGNLAEAYAEGVLAVCRVCVESPLGCAAGVTGSDLKKRIVRIMSGGSARKLDKTRKLLLSSACFIFLMLPLALGLLHAQQTQAADGEEIATADLPKFEVVSIKPYKVGAMMISVRILPDGITMTGMPLGMMIRQAFGLTDDRILNEPGWVKSARYDVAAKVTAADAPKMEKLNPREQWQMMVPVLEGRFGMKFHLETKSVRVYTLVEAKGGPKLQPSKSNEEQMKMGGQMMTVTTKGMILHGHGVPMSQLVRMISGQLGSTVVDKTGLKGKYDFELTFAPLSGFGGMPGPIGPGEGPSPAGPAAAAPQGSLSSGNDESSTDEPPPSLANALQEQLGLKLEMQKEPMDVIVIDSIQQPSPN